MCIKICGLRNGESYPGLEEIVNEIKQKFGIVGEFEIHVIDDPKNGPYIQALSKDLNKKKDGSTPTDFFKIARGVLKEFYPVEYPNELKALIAHEFSHFTTNSLTIKRRIVTIFAVILMIIFSLIIFFPQKLVLVIIMIISILAMCRIYSIINQKLETRCDEEAYYKTQDREALKRALEKLYKIEDESYLRNEKGLPRKILEEVRYCICGCTHPPSKERLAHIDSLKLK